MKPFLILQLRPEAAASDSEFFAICRNAGLDANEVKRIRLDQEALPTELNLDDFSGVIVGGGPGCVSDAPAQKTDDEARIEAEILGLMPQITERDFPFMGCCYGIGILGHHLAQNVSKERYSEPVGTADCRLTTAGELDPVCAGLPKRFDAFVGHKEAMQSLPDGCEHLIEAPSCPYQMIRYGQNVYATQFHPEADGAEFEIRINIYKHKGYFAPAEAEGLIAMCRTANVTAPASILRSFVERYRSLSD
ncbi:glutamine amidotransferase [Lentibacter algarum]|uniref:glutamine amidotransferase n=1 Tax=Lentibacter algarum TaxID=576131 RepID=UPI001C068156|nr:glutamine amidotransferase [Lentibacter algarum]MBU2980422.1 glutamine amidotransferase [Lentibacter algarum]